MLCVKKHSHAQWRDFKMNVLVCDDDRKIVDSIIEELKKKSEEMHVSSRFYGFSQPSQIDLSLPYDIALLDIHLRFFAPNKSLCIINAIRIRFVSIFRRNFFKFSIFVSSDKKKAGHLCTLTNVRLS